MQGEVTAGRGDPDQLFGEDFAGRIGVDEGLDAQAGAGVAGVGKGTQNDMESPRSLLDGGFGEAGDLKKAAGDSGIAGGVEGGGRFGFVGGDGGARIEIGARADRHFDLVKSAFGFDDSVPAEG